MPLPSPDYLEVFDILHNDVDEEVVPVDPLTFPGAGPATMLHWATMKPGIRNQLHFAFEDYANTPAVASAAEVDWLTDIDAAGAIPGFQYADFNNTVSGGNASGLDTTVAAAASHTVDLGGVAAGGTLTGLPFGPGLTYTANAIIDGVTFNLTTTPGGAQNYTALIADLDAIVAGFATFSIVGGNLEMTGDPGVEKVFFRDTQGLDLFQNLTLFAGFFTSVPAVSPVEYTANFLIDGTVVNTIVLGSDGSTFDDVVAELNTDLGGNGSAAIANGDIIVVSGGATGAGTTTVEFQGGSLWQALDGFFGFGLPRLEIDTIFLTGGFTDVVGPVGGPIRGVTWSTFQLEHFGNPPTRFPGTSVDSTLAYHDPFDDDWKRLIDDVVIV
jgi:hypothetical protein